MRFLWYIFFSIALVLAGCNGADIEGSDWEQEVASWKQSRVESLRADWVSLAGLHWLDEGTHTFGSDASNDIQFPASTPPRIGTLRLIDGVVRMEIEPNVEVFADGERVEDAILSDDREGKPTEVELQDVEWYVIEREGRFAVRVHDHARAASLTVDDLPFYPLDADWRVRGRFEPYEPVRIIPVPTVMGTLADMVAPGRIVFEVDGESHALDVLEGSETRYFVMFADQTNRTETYEAGRYVYIDHEDEAGNVVIDFNQSYNPPCAFTPYATCPFPPPQNRLPIDIAAGEKRVTMDGEI